MDNLKILLFDVSPFIYMSYYGATSIFNNQADISDDEKIARVSKNILQAKICNCFEPFQEHKILPVFCYDGKNSTSKKKTVDQNYKANRVHTISKYVREEMLNLVRLFPGYHLINDFEEADDLISTVKFKLKNSLEDCQFFIFSKDNDLLQLCDYRTFFFDPAQGKGARDREYLKEKFNGIENFKHIILHKVCFGDKSDNIDGVFKGKRRKAIVEKIKTCSRFKDFITLDIFETPEQIALAKDLYSIIRLKEDSDFDIKFNSDCSMLDFDIRLEKGDFL